MNAMPQNNIKSLSLIILSFLWCNISLADLYDLKIDLNTSEKTTEKILIQDGYASKCSSNLSDTNDSVSLSMNFYAKPNKLNIDFIVKITGTDDGSLAFNFTKKLNKDGSLGKTKLNDTKITGSSNFKKQTKLYISMFKNMGDNLMSNKGYYPTYGKPLRQKLIKLDGKKEVKRMINFIAKSMPDQSREIKKIGSQIIKNSNINISKEHIGYSIINGQKFYLIRYKFKINYNGANNNYKNFLDQFPEIDQISFFHESGLPTITYDIIPYQDTLMHHIMICKIYKDNVFLSEISVPMLKDVSK